LDIKARFALVKRIAGFQKAWSSVSFKRFGALYYAKDLECSAGTEPLYVDGNGAEVRDEKFAIGPSTGRQWIDNKRASVDVDRGPCKTSTCKIMAPN
jgi:hypothetical protein